MAVYEINEEENRSGCGQYFKGHVLMTRGGLALAILVPIIVIVVAFIGLSQTISFHCSLNEDSSITATRSTAFTDAAIHGNSVQPNVPTDEIPDVSNVITTDLGEITASCPTNRGYKLWTFSDMQICIKYISGLGWLKNYQEMKNRCDEDGAHIVMIENDSMRSHIVDIDSEVNEYPEDYTFLDGQDTDGTGVFINWKNEATWLSWAPGYPQDGNCLASRRVDFNFYHGNINCDQEFQYVLCQFDG